MAAKRKRPVLPTTTLLSLLNPRVERQGGHPVAQAERVRREVIEEITPLIDVWRDPCKSDQTFRQLVKLVQKINGLGIKIRWAMIQVTGTDRNIIGGRVLKIGGTRWVIQPTFDMHPFNLRSYRSWQHHFYSFLISAFATGDFNRLGRCYWQECRKFFFASRLGQKFCKPECTKAADRKAAVKRVDKWRRRQKKKEQRRALEAEGRKAFERFSEFMTLARKNTHSEAELLKIRPILKALGQGEPQKGWRVTTQWDRRLGRGGSLKELWSGITTDQKNIFEEVSLGEATAEVRAQGQGR